MFARTVQSHIREFAEKFPILTITGPRQAGKSTLARMCFPEKPYVNLEAIDIRRFALEDPRGFLSNYAEGAIFDEVQRAPDLFSYLQVLADEDPARRGRFILSGSQQFGMLRHLSQSLAGRTALFELLPFDQSEFQQDGFPRPTKLFETLFLGGYPAIYDRELTPGQWFPSYVSTYVERDIRQLVNVKDTIAFRTFLGLAAASSGQLLNLSRLGADAGITHNTAKSWLSALEASYLCFRVPPFAGSARKSLAKTPKLYFYDTGLLCHLLGIRNSRELQLHPLRGAIFETWVAGELAKRKAHRLEEFHLNFYRDRKGLEVDFLLQQGSIVTALECKSGATLAADFFKAQRTLETHEPALTPLRKTVIYGGYRNEKRSTGENAISWRELHSLKFSDTQ